MISALIDRLFAQHESAILAANTREDLLKALLDLHEEVARHHGETIWLRLSTAVDEGRLGLGGLGKGVEDACCDLFAIAREIHERHGIADRDTLDLVATRIGNAFFDRVDDMANAIASPWGTA